MSEIPGHGLNELQLENQIVKSFDNINDDNSSQYAYFEYFLGFFVLPVL